MRHEPNVMFNTFEEMKKVTSLMYLSRYSYSNFSCNLRFIVNYLQHSGIYILSLALPLKYSSVCPDSVFVYFA
jgi:hypothetical protein